MMIAVVVVTPEVDVEDCVVLVALGATLALDDAALIVPTGLLLHRRFPLLVASTRSNFIAFFARSVSVAFFVVGMLVSGTLATNVAVTEVDDETIGGDGTEDEEGNSRLAVSRCVVGEVGDLIERSRSIDFWLTALCDSTTRLSQICLFVCTSIIETMLFDHQESIFHFSTMLLLCVGIIVTLGFQYLRK